PAFEPASVVDLPKHSRELHLHRQRAANARQPKISIGGVSKHRDGGESDHGRAANCACAAGKTIACCVRFLRKSLTQKPAALIRPALAQGLGYLMSRLVSEAPEHHDAIEGVLARAFGPGRFAKTSERVREHGAHFEPALSRVALNEEGAVNGCCRIWSV